MAGGSSFDVVEEWGLSLVPFPISIFQLGGSTCHRMTWMRAPTFTFFQDLSAVYTRAFKASPSAKQARSPNDNPSHRDCPTRSPTNLPCSDIKGTPSSIGL